MDKDKKELKMITPLNLTPFEIRDLLNKYAPEIVKKTGAHLRYLPEEQKVEIKANSTDDLQVAKRAVNAILFPEVPKEKKKKKSAWTKKGISTIFMLEKTPPSVTNGDQDDSGSQYSGLSTFMLNSTTRKKNLIRLNLNNRGKRSVNEVFKNDNVKYLYLIANQTETEIIFDDKIMSWVVLGKHDEDLQLARVRIEAIIPFLTKKGPTYQESTYIDALYQPLHRFKSFKVKKLQKNFNYPVSEYEKEVVVDMIDEQPFTRPLFLDANVAKMKKEIDAFLKFVHKLHYCLDLTLTFGYLGFESDHLNDMNQHPNTFINTQKMLPILSPKLAIDPNEFKQDIAFTLPKDTKCLSEEQCYKIELEVDSDALKEIPELFQIGTTENKSEKITVWLEPHPESEKKFQISRMMIGPLSFLKMNLLIAALPDAVKIPLGMQIEASGGLLLTKQMNLRIYNDVECWINQIERNADASLQIYPLVKPGLILRRVYHDLLSIYDVGMDLRLQLVSSQLLLPQNQLRSLQVQMYHSKVTNLLKNNQYSCLGETPSWHPETILDQESFKEWIRLSMTIANLLP